MAVYRYLGAPLPSRCRSRRLPTSSTRAADRGAGVRRVARDHGRDGAADRAGAQAARGRSCARRPRRCASGRPRGSGHAAPRPPPAPRRRKASTRGDDHGPGWAAAAGMAPRLGPDVHGSAERREGPQLSISRSATAMHPLVQSKRRWRPPDEAPAVLGAVDAYGAARGVSTAAPGARRAPRGWRAPAPARRDHAARAARARRRPGRVREAQEEGRTLRSRYGCRRSSSPRACGPSPSRSLVPLGKRPRLTPKRARGRPRHARSRVRAALRTVMRSGRGTGDARGAYGSGAARAARAARRRGHRARSRGPAQAGPSPSPGPRPGRGPARARAEPEALRRGARHRLTPTRRGGGRETGAPAWRTDACTAAAPRTGPAAGTPGAVAGASCRASCTRTLRECCFHLLARGQARSPPRGAPRTSARFGAVGPAGGSAPRSRRQRRAHPGARACRRDFTASTERLSASATSSAESPSTLALAPAPRRYIGLEGGDGVLQAVPARRARTSRRAAPAGRPWPRRAASLAAWSGSRAAGANLLRRRCLMHTSGPRCRATSRATSRRGRWEVPHRREQRLLQHLARGLVVAAQLHAELVDRRLQPVRRRVGASAGRPGGRAR